MEIVYTEKEMYKKREAGSGNRKNKDETQDARLDRDTPAYYTQQG